MSWLLEREIRRELPSEWGGVVPTEVFINEAKRIVGEADRKNLVIRVIGGLAILMHSEAERKFAEKLKRVGTGVIKRQEYSDIDLMAYRKDREKITEFMKEMNYVKRKATLSTAASERQIYFHPKGWFYVDIFYDRLLVANHPIDFRGRLELDYPTVPVTDLLLEKLQIWEAFSEKDLKDVLILLKAHDVGEKQDKEIINSSYIAKILSSDWGFYYTVKTNLSRIKNLMINLEKHGSKVNIDPKLIKKEEVEVIVNRIEKLIGKIESEPKTVKWKLRSKIGTKKKWYNPVEREETVAGFGIWEAILK